MFSGKRILVTGATGLIGNFLVRRLLEENAIVIAQGRSEEKIKKVFKKELDNDNFLYNVGNVADGIEDTIGSLDYIFHAASPISGAEIKEKPVGTIAANIYGAINCLEFLKNQGYGRMVVFSSATVYGNIDSKDRIVTENDTRIADPLDYVAAPYSESKRMVEVIARAYANQYSVETVIVRISYVYGYSYNMPNTAFYEFINKALMGEDITLNNSGMARRDNIHVSDVIKALLLVAEKGKIGEVYNISSGGDKENYKAIDELAQVIADSATLLKGKRIKVNVKETKKERGSGIILDNRKLKELGWNVSKNINNGILETMELYAKRYKERNE